VTILLLVLAILLVGGTALLVSGRTPPARFRAIGRSIAAEAMAPPVASLPPVLLPDSPTARDVDALRFGLGLRGYRMEQVDQVLDRLAGALDERDAVISDLRGQLGSGTAGSTPAP
jgi:DivIVA domain-containing protein